MFVVIYSEKAVITIGRKDLYYNKKRLSSNGIFRQRKEKIPRKENFSVKGKIVQLGTDPNCIILEF